MFNLYVHHAPANYHFVSDKQNGFGLVLSFFFCDSLNKLPIIQVSLWYGPIILISSTLKCHTKKSLHTIWLFQLRQKTPKFKPDPWKALSDIPAHNHFLLTNSDFTNKDQNKKLHRSLVIIITVASESYRFLSKISHGVFASWLLTACCW